MVVSPNLHLKPGWLSCSRIIRYSFIGSLDPKFLWNNPCTTGSPILLMATRNPANSPVEVGRLCHYLGVLRVPRNLSCDNSRRVWESGRRGVVENASCNPQDTTIGFWVKSPENYLNTLEVNHHFKQVDSFGWGHSHHSPCLFKNGGS